MFDCAVCTSTANLVKRLARNVIGRAFAVRVVMNACTRYNLATKDTCAKIIEAHKVHFLYVLQRTELSGRQICERLDYCAVPREYDAYPADYLPLEYYGDHAYDHNDEGQSVRIAHLTDVHLDLDYLVGSEAECGDVICCHRASGGGGNVTRAAGPFGDYKCDTPRATIRTFLDHLSGNKPDLIALTGDMAAHDVWSESRAKAMLTEGALARMLAGTGGGALVVPAVGNHETVPANSFPYGNQTGQYSNDWLYSSLSLQWLPFLEDTEKLQFIRHGRYKHIIPEKKVMVIALNTNIPYLFNVWRLMYYPDADSDGQLAWLEGALALCAADRLKAVVIGHHPPGERDLSAQWTRQFLNITRRYTDSILLMLFGHTHLDSFRVFTRQHLVSIVSPSMATWTETPPCYRIFDATADQIVSHETYVMDLSSGKWSSQYAFNCTRTLFECYEEYLQDIKSSEQARKEFIKHHFKSSQVRMANCTEKCQRKIIDALEYNTGT